MKDICVCLLLIGDLFWSEHWPCEGHWFVLIRIAVPTRVCVCVIGSRRRALIGLCPSSQTQSFSLFTQRTSGSRARQQSPSEIAGNSCCDNFIFFRTDLIWRPVWFDSFRFFQKHLMTVNINTANSCTHSTRALLLHVMPSFDQSQDRLLST